MGSGFPGHCSPTATWPQELMNGGLVFREIFSPQAALRRATPLSLASQALGANFGSLVAVGPYCRAAHPGGFHAENSGWWPKVKCAYLWLNHMYVLYM